MPLFTSSPRLLSAAVKEQLGVGPTCKIVGQVYIIWS